MKLTQAKLLKRLLTFAAALFVGMIIPTHAWAQG